MNEEPGITPGSRRVEQAAYAARRVIAQLNSHSIHDSSTYATTSTPAETGTPAPATRVPANFRRRSAARYFLEKLKFATGLVGVAYVSGRASVTVLHEFRSALSVFQLYW